MAKTIFVLGTDDFNDRMLRELEAQTDYEFRGLLPFEYVNGRVGDRLEALLDEAGEILDAHREREEGRVDGIIQFWDFPVQTMLPLLREREGLPTPSLESVLKCEHKLWARQVQAEVVGDHVPAFTWCDPFDDGALDRIELPFPFWIKPVKATASKLGYLVRDASDFAHAIAGIRRGIGEYSGWFDQFLDRADLPDSVSEVRGHHCVAEEVLEGTQHTLSGWAAADAIGTYGVVDSITYPGRPSFFRYHYPSKLPHDVTDRMARIARSLMTHVGFQHEAFNIEFFYEEGADRLHLLEVNPRISQSHGFIYDKVDGMPNHKIAADVSLGERPTFPHREGTHRVAAKFYLRTFDDGWVARGPSHDDRRRVEEAVEGVTVDLRAYPGDDLASSSHRDSYSVELAHVYVGADGEDELLARYEETVEMLGYEVEPRG